MQQALPVKFSRFSACSDAIACVVFLFLFQILQLGYQLDLVPDSHSNTRAQVNDSSIAAHLEASEFAMDLQVVWPEFAGRVQALRQALQSR